MSTYILHRFCQTWTDRNAQTFQLLMFAIGRCLYRKDLQIELASPPSKELSKAHRIAWTNDDYNLGRHRSLSSNWCCDLKPWWKSTYYILMMHLIMNPSPLGNPLCVITALFSHLSCSLINGAVSWIWAVSTPFTETTFPFERCERFCRDKTNNIAFMPFANQRQKQHKMSSSK